MFEIHVDSISNNRAWNFFGGGMLSLYFKFLYVVLKYATQHIHIVFSQCEKYRYIYTCEDITFIKKKKKYRYIKLKM